MELDHIFLFVPDEETAVSMMRDAGLHVSYSRRHPGQGTRNLCACLDDVYLELLWLDGTEVSPESERISLGRRGRGDGIPLGVSWRGPSNLECEPYAAPFLPSGVTIPVARASLDAAMPFVFQSPGGSRPADWTDGLAGSRQCPRFKTLGECELRVPHPDAVAKLMAPFERISLSDGVPGLRATLIDQVNITRGEVNWIAASS